MSSEQPHDISHHTDLRCPYSRCQSIPCRQSLQIHRRMRESRYESFANYSVNCNAARHSRALKKYFKLGEGRDMIWFGDVEARELSQQAVDGVLSWLGKEFWRGQLYTHLVKVRVLLKERCAIVMVAQIRSMAAKDVAALVMKPSCKEQVVAFAVWLYRSKEILQSLYLSHVDN